MTASGEITRPNQLAKARELLRRPSTLVIVLAGVGLVVNLATGVVLARALTPEDRGEVAALTVLNVVLSWVAAFGQRGAITYLAAPQPQRVATVTRSALPLILPTTLVAMAIGWIVVPLVLGSKPEAPTTAGRVFVLALPAFALYEISLGVLAGSHRFTKMAIARITPYLITLVALAVLVSTDAVTTATALAATAAGYVGVALWIFPPLLARRGDELSERKQARQQARDYGARTVGQQVGMIVNTRLDVLMLSSYVAAPTVAFYAVASNLASIISSLADGLLGIVLARGASDRHQRRRVVLQATGVVLVFGLGLTIVWLTVGKPLLGAVYGGAFEHAAKYAVVLSLGAAFLAAAGVVGEGIAAHGHPLVQGTVHGVAALATIVGLVLILPAHGAMGAALVSLCVYGGVFVLMSLLFWKIDRAAR